MLIFHATVNLEFPTSKVSCGFVSYFFAFDVSVCVFWPLLVFTSSLGARLPRELINDALLEIRLWTSYRTRFMYTCLFTWKLLKSNWNSLKELNCAKTHNILISSRFRWAAETPHFRAIDLTVSPSHALRLCANLWSNPKQFHHNTLADNYFVYWTNIRVVSHKFERATTTITKQNRPHIHSRTKTSTTVAVGHSQLLNARSLSKPDLPWANNKS